MPTGHGTRKRSAFVRTMARQPARQTSFHSIEGLLENLLIAGFSEFLSRLIDPFFLQRILRRAIGLVEHAEDAGEWELGKFVRGELVSDVVAKLVLGCVVPFLFLDHFETAALLRIGWIEYVGEKFD